MGKEKRKENERGKENPEIGKGGEGEEKVEKKGKEISKEDNVDKEGGRGRENVEIEKGGE